MSETKVNIMAEPKALIALRNNKIFAKSRNIQQVFRNARIILIMDKELFESQWANSESQLRKFFHSYDMRKPCVLSELKNIYNSPALCYRVDPFAIWFLNKSQSDINNFHDLLGLMAISPQSLNDDIFKLEHCGDYTKWEIIEGNGNGWENFVNQMNKPIPPFNALVVNDRYLFANTDNNGNFYGIQNLINLFEAILPASLKAPLQITIFSYHSNTTAQVIDNAIQKLRTELQAMRNYHINIDVIYGRAHHKRALYSNYFVLFADKGFNAFSASNPKKLAGENSFSIKSYLNNPFSTGSTEYENARKWMNEIKEICVQAYNAPILHDNNNENIRRIDLQQEDSFQNRLLNL